MSASARQRKHEEEKPCCGRHFIFIPSYYAALLPRRGPHIASHSVCLSVCLSVCPSVCLSVRPSRYCFCLLFYTPILRANIQNRKTSVFAYGPASRMYFSAHTEGRISYGHLGRTNLLISATMPSWHPKYTKSLYVGVIE